MSFASARIRSDNVTQSLPEKLKDLMIQLSGDLGVKRFILYGGAAMDLFLEPKYEIRDLDIAIHSDERDKEFVKKQLQIAGYRIIGSDRQYFLNIIDPVTIIDAYNDQRRLDIAFLKGPLERKMNMVPPSAYHTTMDKFDIHSVFWRYPELDCVDLYDAFEALKNKTMRPLHSLYEENPYLLINHIINMCAKYSMSLSNNPVHKKIIEVLLKRIERWSYSDKFHGYMVKLAHYSTILKAVNRAKDTEAFIHDLAASNILAHTMPELQEPLKKISQAQSQALAASESKQKTAEILLTLVSEVERKALSQRFQLLGMRSWDLEDQAVANDDFSY
jgi:hypothetical protein